MKYPLTINPRFLARRAPAAGDKGMYVTQIPHRVLRVISSFPTGIKMFLARYTLLHAREITITRSYLLTLMDDSRVLRTRG